MLCPHTYACAIAQKTHQIVRGLVLQHIHTVCPADNGLALREDELTCDVVVVAEVTIEAGIEEYHTGIWTDVVNLLKDDTLLEVKHRVLLNESLLVGIEVPLHRVQTPLLRHLVSRLWATAVELTQAVLHLLDMLVD